MEWNEVGPSTHADSLRSCHSCLRMWHVAVWCLGVMLMLVGCVSDSFLIFPPFLVPFHLSFLFRLVSFFLLFLSFCVRVRVCSLQVHGTSNTIYNIISTPTLQYNALFTYLESGNCRKGTACYSHAGNYFGEVGLMLKDASGAISSFQITSGAVAAGLTVTSRSTNATLPVSADAVSIGSYRLQHSSPFELVIESGEFSIRMQNSDHFINQDVSIGSSLMQLIAQHKQAVKQGDSEEAARLAALLPHGVLGQSWQSGTYANRWKYIQGQLFDYVESELLGSSFKYNRF